MVREYLVGNGGGVVPEVDVLDADDKHLSDHDAAKGVDDGGVNADKVKLDGALREAGDIDFQPSVLEVGNGPRNLCLRQDVGYAFWLNTNYSSRLKQVLQDAK